MLRGVGSTHMSADSPAGAKTSGSHSWIVSAIQIQREQICVLEKRSPSKTRAKDRVPGMMGTKVFENENDLTARDVC